MIAWRPSSASNPAPSAARRKCCAAARRVSIGRSSSIAWSSTSSRAVSSSRDAEGALASPRAGDAGGRSSTRGRLLSPRILHPLLRSGPALEPRHPIRATLPPHAGPHPRGVGSILPRLRSLPAPSHRLAPLRDRGHRQGLLGGRPRPRQRDDLPLPRVRLLPSGHRVLLDLVHRGRVLLAIRLPRG